MIIYNTYPVDKVNSNLLYSINAFSSTVTSLLQCSPDAEFLMYNNTHQNNMLKTHNNKKKRIGEKSRIVVLMLHLVLPALLDKNSPSPA